MLCRSLASDENVLLIRLSIVVNFKSFFDATVDGNRKLPVAVEDHSTEETLQLPVLVKSVAGLSDLWPSVDLVTRLEGATWLQVRDDCESRASADDYAFMSCDVFSVNFFIAIAMMNKLWPKLLNILDLIALL